MTSSKKNILAKEKTLESYDNFLLEIDNYFNKRLKEYDHIHSKKLEKIEDKLYFATLKKDFKLEHALKNKDEKNKLYSSKLSSLKILYEDLKISKEDYNKKISFFKNKYEEGKHFEKNYESRVKKINSSYELKKKKLRDEHDKKKDLYKKYRVKYESNEKKLKDKSIKNLENKRRMVLEANDNFQEKMNLYADKKIKKINLKKDDLKKSFDSKKIGIHTYNKEIKKLDNDVSNIKLAIANKKRNYAPKILNSEILLSKSRRIINENNNKFFFPGVFSEARKIVSKNKIIFIILLLLFYTALNNSAFWKFQTFSNIMKNNSEIMILALSMTMVILTGGIDLSVGSLMAFGGILISDFAQKGTDIYLSIIVGILITTLLGFLQGLLIGYAKMVPFVVTLGGLLAYRGASVLVSNARPIQVTGHANEVLVKLANSEFLGINVQIWIVLICFAIFMFVLRFTVFGRQIYAIGSNRRAAFLSGVKDKKVETIVYTLSGTMAGLAGLLISARTQSISPTTGTAWELQAIACVVIGGTALTGGKGGLVGTIIGWLILSSLPTTFQTLGIDPNMQKVSTGLIIVVAVLLNNNLDFKGGLIGIRKRTTLLFNQYFKRRKI